MTDAPVGTVTFVFTDIEGSTKLLDELGAEPYAAALDQHRRVVREALASGYEVDTQGDAFFYAFARAGDALHGSVEAVRGLEAGPIRVRIGIHTGEPLLAAEGYVGIDVHRAARIAAVAHGGQIVVSQSTRALVPDEELLELGEHRLKDLTGAERLYQYGPGSFPPLRSLNRTNLPVATSPLIGRTRELAEVTAMLSNGHRLVTLTGPGGSGKTRLALQAGAELVDDFADGVFFVRLAGLRDPALVPSAIASEADVATLDALSRRRVLLVVDNFEHVISAAGDIAELVAAGPEARVLVTSRSPLRVAGEAEYQLDPLSELSAVVLFAERGRAVGREVELDETAEAICERLDNLPLAVELAAARLRTLDPETLLERLDERLPLLTHGARDAPARQQTLAATIAWSYELLTADSQRLFERLSVFTGTFSLAAAEEVCDATLDLIESLVELSLLKALERGRFLMLDTVREFATSQRSEAADLEERHARYFFRVAGEMGAALYEKTLDAPVYERIAADLDNLRAAFAWGTRHDALAAGEACYALGEFWNVRGGAAEALRVVECVPLDDLAPEAQLRMLGSLAMLRWTAGDVTGSREADEQRHALAVETGSREVIASTLNNLAVSYQAEGELDQAIEAYRQAIGFADSYGALAASNNLSRALVDAQRLAEADQVMATLLEQGSGAISGVKVNLARVRIEQGKLHESAGLLEETVDEACAVGGGMLNDCLCLTARLAGLTRQPEAAARLLGAADSNHPHAGWHVAGGVRDRATPPAEQALGPERFEQLFDEGRDLTPEQAGSLVHTVTASVLAEDHGTE
jgi:predicted ATPase/class 3 adenylate cyclase